MTAGKCELCGRNFKMLENHKCKSKTDALLESKNKEIEKAIENAKTVEELNKVSDNISNLVEQLKNNPAMTPDPILKSDTNPTPINQVEPMPPTYKKTFWEKVFWKGVFKSKQKPIEVFDPEELINYLKPYQIPDANPKTGIGKLTNRNKDFIQVVLVSELVEPKTFWAEKTGINRIQYKDRMYKLPRDIRGNVFFWHVDKKQPLIDTANASQDDAESSFHELQLFNMAYSVGRAAGANDLLNNLKFILIMVGLTLLLAFISIAFSYGISKDMKTNDQTILNAIAALNNSISR